MSRTHVSGHVAPDLSRRQEIQPLPIFCPLAVGLVPRFPTSRRDPQRLSQAEGLRKFPRGLGQFPLSFLAEPRRVSAPPVMALLTCPADRHQIQDVYALSSCVRKRCRLAATCVYSSRITPQQPTISQNSQRRPSRLSQWLSNEKIEQARRMTPEERLTVALHLSDFCRELNRACSPKP